MARKAITTQFEEMLLEAGRGHGFHAVSAGFNSHCSVGNWWSVAVHWRGFSRTGNPCATGSGSTIPEALRKAIDAAELDRKPYSKDPVDMEAREKRIAELRDQLAELTDEAA